MGATLPAPLQTAPAVEILLAATRQKINLVMVLVSVGLEYAYVAN